MGGEQAELIYYTKFQGGLDLNGGGGHFPLNAALLGKVVAIPVCRHATGKNGHQ